MLQAIAIVVSMIKINVFIKLTLVIKENFSYSRKGLSTWLLWS